MPVTSRETGEVRRQIFVGVLGDSNFTYAEAYETQELSEWIAAHVRMTDSSAVLPRSLYRLNIDYHIDVLGHDYSRPYTQAWQPVDVRISRGTMEVYRDGRRVAAHVRSRRQDGCTTEATHDPIHRSPCSGRRPG